MTTVKAFQKPQKGDPIGLDNYDLSKFPNTGDYLTPLFDARTGKYLAGLDEYDPQILAIKDPEERKRQQERVKELKKQLEELTGLDLNPKNYEFWDNYVIPFVVDIKGNVREFHPDLNPMDSLALIVLKRRGDIPFSKAEMYDPRYKDAKFYLTTNEEEVIYNKGKIRLERERNLKMADLFSSEESNYDRAWNIAYYLNLKPRKGCSFDKLEEDLELYTTEGNKKENTLDNFLEACKLSNQDLLTANSFKRAVVYNLIKFSPADKVYHRGGVNYRATEKESIEYLKTPEMAGELTEVIAAVRKKEANRKNIA